MKIIALESSAITASVAITEDEKLLAQAFQNSGLTHSATLMPMAADLLKNTGLTLDEMDVVAVAAGPGSFTGVRIGVAAAKGLAWPGDKPCAPVPPWSPWPGSAPMWAGRSAPPWTPGAIRCIVPGFGRKMGI